MLLPEVLAAQAGCTCSVVALNLIQCCVSGTWFQLENEPGRAGLPQEGSPRNIKYQGAQIPPLEPSTRCPDLPGTGWAQLRGPSPLAVTEDVASEPFPNCCRQQFLAPAQLKGSLPHRISAGEV